jgi:endonuclease YncB( thermonuclease family)
MTDNDLLITPNEIFTFKSDTIMKCRICHVYDGDSVHIVFKYKGEVIKVVARLYGIDTPEMSVKEQYSEALIARNRLIQLVTDWDIFLCDTTSSKSKTFNERLAKNTKIIDVKFVGRDKYNRELCELYVDGKSVNDILLLEKQCYEYFGGTKQK